MSEYQCDICNYSTDKYFNFKRHTETKLHIKKCNEKDNEIKLKKQEWEKEKKEQKKNKNKTIRNSGIFICNNCDEEFEDKQAKYRHQKKCKGINKITDNKEVPLKGTINKSKLINYSSMSKEQLCELLNKKDELLSNLVTTNVNTTTITANVSESANKSMSMMKYAMTNFKGAPVLEQLQKPQIKQLMHHEGSLKSRDNVSEYTLELITHYKKYEIIEHIGKLIVAYLGTNVSAEQRQIWTTDVSRLSFIVMEYVNRKKEKEWCADKTGKRLVDLVIDPILDYICNMLQKYLGFEKQRELEYMKEFDNNNKKLCEDSMKNTGIAMAIIKDMRSEKFRKELLKYVAPYFNFDVNKLDYTKDKKQQSSIIEERPKKAIKKVNKKELSKTSYSSDSFTKHFSDTPIDQKPKKITKK